MPTLAGFLVPFVVAAAAYPGLLRCGRCLWLITFGTCVLIVSSPWFIPADAPLVRFIASISAAVLAIKFIDAARDVQRGRPPSWRAFADFLAHPFTHVRRSLVQERRPSRRESLLTVLAASTTCALAAALLWALLQMDWSDVPFLVEHAGKAAALMLMVTSALGAAAALWRLGGGTARDYMDRPFIATTPAEFWRRYNRNVHQFFWQDVFGGRRSRSAPIRSILLIFALSALLHEFIFLAAIGEVQGYQTAFFLLQGLAAAATARVRVKGWRVVPWMAGTLVFNLLSSVLFFASLHQVAPIYAHGLPLWLR
jgi:hypothetical protein